MRDSNPARRVFYAVFALVCFLFVSGIVFQFYKVDKGVETIPQATAEIVYPDEISVFRVIKREAIENSSLTQTILYDPSTLVMYAYTSGTAHSSSITPLYNSDGTLRLYNEKLIDLY